MTETPESGTLHLTHLRLWRRLKMRGMPVQRASARLPYMFLCAPTCVAALLGVAARVTLALPFLECPCYLESSRLRGRVWWALPRSIRSSVCRRSGVSLRYVPHARVWAERRARPASPLQEDRVGARRSARVSFPPAAQTWSSPNKINKVRFTTGGGTRPPTQSPSSLLPKHSFWLACLRKPRVLPPVSLSQHL